MVGMLCSLRLYLMFLCIDSYGNSVLDDWNMML